MSVDYQPRGDVAVITFNRPDRFNAIEAGLSQATVEGLARAGSEARAVVVTGAGKAFCSGADLADLLDDYEKGGPDLSAHLDRVFHPMIDAFLTCPVPVVAAINGVAAGAGLGIALACDIRLMAESAYLTSAFTAIGLAPDSGTTWWLPQMVGVARAIEWTMTNRHVSAGESLELGLCSRVVPLEELVEAAVEQAAGLADLVPDSLVTTRRLIRDAAGSSFQQARRAEQVEQGRLGRTPQHLEGVNAFLEKRKANFRNPG